MIISYAEIFTLTTAAGINTFTQKEYVFQNDSKISELTWDCPIIPYIELGVSSRLHNFEFNLSYATVIPIKSGTLKDLDFNSTDISQYSSHNLYVDKNYAFTFQAGYNFSSKNLFFPHLQRSVTKIKNFLAETDIINIQKQVAGQETKLKRT